MRKRRKWNMKESSHKKKNKQINRVNQPLHTENQILFTYTNK